MSVTGGLAVDLTRPSSLSTQVAEFSTKSILSESTSKEPIEEISIELGSRSIGFFVIFSFGETTDSTATIGPSGLATWVFFSMIGFALRLQGTSETIGVLLGTSTVSVLFSGRTCWTTHESTELTDKVSIGIIGTEVTHTDWSLSLEISDF
ncbi:hypothetical protein DAPPUDRAFT_305279 [Daphnia pulex]|uniref:Uncharacterized protein n=1 Tax=Daphnia pulex TaxID=6669 RepID=E9GRE7_DAPPU|nr:hypothetical protein DAPPUDRAFT_305279 [Daphnia pulex]|eukprot:EFX77995.1 hypothetical protein DAPPUDRAFT_305279 [Daphnia pulex]